MISEVQKDNGWWRLGHDSELTVGPAREKIVLELTALVQTNVLGNPARGAAVAAFHTKPHRVTWIKDQLNIQYTYNNKHFEYLEKFYRNWNSSFNTGRHKIQNTGYSINHFLENKR